MVSETGVDTKELGDTAKAILRNKETSKLINDIELIVSLFQYGPSTGNKVYSETYADSIYSDIKKKCMSGNVTGLVAIRETRKYPIISGEIIKIKGYCLP